MATWKNFEFKMWLKEINASCLSQEKLKLEAMKFSEKFDNVDKKTISKICDNFEKEHKKIWKEASYKIFEEMGGTDGKMRGRKDVPPNNYFPKDQSDLKMIKVEKNMETKCEDCNITSWRWCLASTSRQLQVVFDNHYVFGFSSMLSVQVCHLFL